MSDGSILPVVRYADPVAAANWLCSAYGFSIHHAAEQPEGGTAYVVVRFGESIVLVGPQGSSEFDDLMVQPADVGNRSTQTCYLTVKDVDQHFAHAKTAGARIEFEPRDDGSGGRFYMCRDPEGHLWSFGGPLVGATLAGPERPSAPRYYSAIGGRAAIGLAALLGFAVASSAMLYLGAGWGPKALTLLADQREQDGNEASSAKRLADAEAAAVDLTEKLQISQLEFTEAQQLKRNAEQLLRAAEAEHQIRLKDSRAALDDAVRAKEVASQELEAERQRAQAIQTKLDEASQQLVRLRQDGSKFEVEARRLRTAMAQLGDALLGSTQAAEIARDRLAAAENTEKQLNERLSASQRETAALRARVAELESDKEPARGRRGQAAQAARTALAIDRANELMPRDKLVAGGRGTEETPPRATVSESETDAARLRTMQAAAEAARTALAVARANQFRPRDKLVVGERGTAKMPPRAIASQSGKEAARLRTVQAAEAARTAPAIDRANPLRPRGKLPTGDRVTAATPPRAIVSDTEKTAPEARAEKAAETARKALTTAQAREVTPRDKVPTGERGTAETPPRAIMSGTEKEAAKVPTKPAAEVARKAPAAAAPSELAPRDTAGASARRTAELSQHHLMQGKKWNTVAAIEKGEPQVPVSPAAPKSHDNPARSVCALAVRDLVFDRRSGGALQTRVVKRLCVDSHATQEPAKCLARLMNGRVSWGGGTDWDFKNAVDLCARTRNAATTLSCFSRKIAAKASWESAIATCSAT